MGMDQKNKAYWLKRAAEELKLTDKEVEASLRTLQGNYDEILLEMEKNISLFYAKYGENNVIEFSNLRKKLSSQELKDLYRDFDSFALEHPEYKHLAPVRDEYYKYSRWDYLTAKSKFKLLELTSSSQRLFTSGMKGTAQRSYMNSLNDLGGMGSLNDEALDKILNKKWFGNKNYSDRLWGKVNGFEKELTKQLKNTIIRGESYNKTASVLAKRLDVQFSDAKRLLKTEHNYVSTAGRLKSFEDMGVEEYEFIATLDDRTSDICASKDGMRFYVSGAKFGENIPPLHAHCRSVIVPVTDSKRKRAYRGKDGKTSTSNYRTYKEWSVANDVGTTPGIGRVSIETGAKPNPHEKEVTKYLSEKFGGDIMHLNEIQGQKNADILWNDKQWEIKGYSGALRNINKRIQEGATQSDKLILDVIGLKESDEVIISTVSNRITNINKNLGGGRHEIIRFLLIRDGRVLEYFKLK